MDLPSHILEEARLDSKLDNIVFDRRFKECENDPLKTILALIRDGYIHRNKYGNLIGDAIDEAYLPLSETLFENDVLQLIPQEIAERYGAIAIYQLGDTVSIAIEDPTNFSILSIVRGAIGKQVSTVFSFSDEIQNAIKLHYAAARGLDSLLDEGVENKRLNREVSNDELIKLSNTQEIKDLVDMIVYLALRDRASDIHIEPKKYHVLLRFRRDGRLFNKAVLPSAVVAPLISRIKILANLDIMEKRKPQDGRFDFDLPQFTADLRVSILPSLHGEKVVARLLGTDLMDKCLDFETLGFDHEIIDDISHALNSPNGMLFVTGPTGSGKTTTLHCALNYLNKPSINIVTIEDPIEYEHPDITQVSINNKMGRDFPTVLRSVLRQDPDVIMIGEIRDLETAKIAANAAMTGHMVLTSLHTNDAIQAVTRMVEMGVEHFVVAPSIIGVLGQRLVRRICTQCKTQYTPEKAYLEQFFDLSDLGEIPSLYYGAGCQTCKNEGFYGRIAIHEYLGVTPALRNCILRGTDYDEFFHVARQTEDYRPFHIDGFKKALKGLTTLEEIQAVANLQLPQSQQ